MPVIRSFVCAATVFAAALSASASWTTFSMHAVDNAWGATAFDHLSDGRYVYGQSGSFYLQDAFGAAGYSTFSASPVASTDPSFIAAHNDNTAVAGMGGWSPSAFQAFDPSDTGSTFSEVGSAVQNYNAAFYNASALIVGGATNNGGFGWDHHAVRYVALDSSTVTTIVDDVSLYSGALAVDASGNLYVGDNDDGSVYRFTSAQVDAAVAGTTLTLDDGVFMHQFGSVGSLAVDGNGNVWAAGYGMNGIEVYNPTLGLTRSYIPALDNAYYKVDTFSTGGQNYIAWLNRDGWNPSGGDAITYGYTLAYFVSVPEPATAGLALLGALLLGTARGRKRV